MNTTTVSAKYTSTCSIFVLSASGFTLALDFFSSVPSSNLVRKSKPFSYLSVKATTTAAAFVQIYSDINSS